MYTMQDKVLLLEVLSPSHFFFGLGSKIHPIPIYTDAVVWREIDAPFSLPPMACRPTLLQGLGLWVAEPSRPAWGPLKVFGLVFV